MNFHTITHSVQASGDGSKRRFVTFAGAQAVVGSNILGVALTDYSTGKMFVADIIGVTAVESGGEVMQGGSVVPDAQGRGVTAAVDAANIVGKAMNGTTGPGQTLFVLLR